MEGAALFIVGSYLRVRVGAVFLTIANQERQKKDLIILKYMIQNLQ